MSDILDLVRSGRLEEATARIQGRLGAGDAEPEADRPMRDVTPTARSLPHPDGTPDRAPAGERARAKPKREAAKPRPGAVGQMERRSGAVDYRLHAPAVPRDDAILIVMLHGCTQTPEDFAAGTRMNAAAAAIGAHVVWPEQSRSSNPNGCWSWFEPGHQGRRGEAAAIVSVVSDVLEEIGGARDVHVAGLSAGAAMAAILGAEYPEVFASVGLHSGLPVGSARDVASAFSAMRSGGHATKAVAVPSIVFHGSADRTVDIRNLDAFMPKDPGAKRRNETAGGRPVTVLRAEAPWPVEIWEVDGLGHAWSGGSATGSYADPAGPDATAEMLRFFQDVSARRA